MDKEIAQARVETELNAYEGRPYSREHNVIPEPDQSGRYVSGGGNNLHSFMKELEEEEETKEEREIEEQEPEMEAEEERRIEDPIDTEEADESPTFDIRHCKNERQAVLRVVKPVAVVVSNCLC